MKWRKLNSNDLVLIAANLVPVFGVWFLGWSATEVFIVYAMETLIAGLVTILKLGVMTIARGKDTWYNEAGSTTVSGLFFILFFIAHFGLFALVQTTIFSESAKISPPGSGMFHFFLHWYEYINKDIAVMLGCFLLSYLATRFVPFVVGGDYRRLPMMIVMFQPYGRIVLQQFTVILGSMFLGFGWNKGFILVFAAAKIFFDVYVNFDHVLEKTRAELERTHDNKNP